MIDDQSTNTTYIQSVFEIGYGVLWLIGPGPRVDTGCFERVVVCNLLSLAIHYLNLWILLIHVLYRYLRVSGFGKTQNFLYMRFFTVQKNEWVLRPER
jgi:hypothetical protein